MVQDVKVTDYQLHTLGTREFEHLTQALAVKVIGQMVSVFGDGPDAGREATWDGQAPALSGAGDWNGYGVLQAKFQARPSKPSDNLKWFERQIRAELEQWARPGTKRDIKPEYFLIATNALLSPSPDNGKDAAKKFVASEIERLSLPIVGFRIWDFDDLRSLLDDADGIRRRYAAFLTAGDVIASLLDFTTNEDRDLGKALATSAALSLTDDAPLNLTQAGVMSESAATIADVFVDLPSTPADTLGRALQGIRRLHDPLAEHRRSAPERGDAPPVILDFSTSRPQRRRAAARVDDGIAARLIDHLNHSRDTGPEAGVEAASVVIVGGPGQGKSTVTQWLAQLYRVHFLRDNPALRMSSTVSQIARKTGDRARSLSMPEITARRWPVRIILTEVADYLASHPGASLIQFISSMLSTRGSTPIDASSVLRWMEMYPSVIFIDGLDEVPPSSNRTAVLRAISDLTVELDTRGGDVVVIVTTRPQGYAGELGKLSHFELDKLDIEVATECARALVNVRFGSGTSKSSQVMERLRKASKESATAKLFESPLQVTILTVLLEKLGKAPGDRSRLFSAYYEVISSREQEKSGELSDLLQRYEADIRTLHHDIGFELQRRAADAGATSATLSSEEFQQTIADQFRAQGHNEAEIDELRREFARLVTDRLVFLTFVAGDRVGFEIRSLQEFMAGERIVGLPENRILDELRHIASSAYWRNVVLFAAGSIFAHRPHLRAEVVLLCQELDAGESEGVLFPGSQLAMDILQDGSCLAMPLYTERLAATASAVLDGPIFQVQTRRLARLGDPRVQGIVRAKASSTEAAGQSVWVNRAIFWRSVWPNADSNELTETLRAAGSDARRAIIRYSWAVGDPVLLEAVDPYLHDARGSDFVREGDRPYEDAELPPSFTALTALTGRDLIEDLDPDTETFLWGKWVRLSMDAQAWMWVRDESPRNENWRHLQAISIFAADPSPVNLAASLRALSQVAEEEYPVQTPWVLSLCSLQVILNVEAHPSGAEWSRVKEYERLAVLAERGELGALEEWLDIEKRSASPLAIHTDTVASFAEDVDDLSDSRPNQRVPFSVISVVFSSSPRPDAGEVLDILQRVIEVSRVAESKLTAARLRSAALFLLSMLVEDVEELEAFVLERADDLMYWADEASKEEAEDGTWWSWLELSLKVRANLPDANLLDRLGRMKQLIRNPSSEVGSRLMTVSGDEDRQWPILRLALLSDPSLAIEPSLVIPDGDGPSDVYSRFHRVLSTVRQAFRAGQSSVVVTSSDLTDATDAMNRDWMLRVAREDGARTIDIARLAELLSRVDAVSAMPFTILADAKLQAMNPDLSGR
jgi:hypothetical protein